MQACKHKDYIQRLNCYLTQFQHALSWRLVFHVALHKLVPFGGEIHHQDCPCFGIDLRIRHFRKLAAIKLFQDPQVDYQLLGPWGGHMPLWGYALFAKVHAMMVAHAS